MRISDLSSDVCSSDLVLSAKHKDEEGNPAPLDPAFFDNALANRDSHSGFSIDDDGDLDLDDILSEVEGDPDAENEANDSDRSEEHPSELQSLMRSSYAVFCLKKNKKVTRSSNNTT